jgi:hypothetical protein
LLWRWFCSARLRWEAVFTLATLAEEFVIVNFEPNPHHRKDPNTSTIKAGVLKHAYRLPVFG